MPGPASAPTKLKILKGVRPCRINQNEPKPNPVGGKIPWGWATWMSKGARRFWERYAPKLSKLGILTEADLPALRILSELWAKWIRYTNLVNSGKLDSGIELKYMRILNQVEAQMLRYLAHFGMTASSRGKISVAKMEIGDDKALNW